MANVPAALKDWSATAGSNQPDSTDAIGPNGLRGDLQQIQATVRAELATRGTIASASTCDIGAENASTLDVTGTTAITSFGTVAAGIRRRLVFASALVLTYNATSLKLPTAANITTQAGDIADFESLGSGNWQCQTYLRADGSSLTLGGYLPNGSAAAPALALLNSTNTGIYRVADDQIGFSADGTLRFDIGTTFATSAVRLKVPDGTSVAPAIRGTSGDDTSAAGLYFTANNVVVQGDGSATSLTVGSSSVNIDNGALGPAAAMNITCGGSTAPDNTLNIVLNASTSTTSNIIKVTMDNDGTPNPIWRVRNDGATFADGAYSSAGADYAEAFLPADGESLEPGDTVVLDGACVRRARWWHWLTPWRIVGVVSESPSAIGDSKLIDAGGVPVGLVGKLRINPGRPRRLTWRHLGGGRYLVGV